MASSNGHSADALEKETADHRDNLDRLLGELDRRRVQVKQTWQIAVRASVPVLLGVVVFAAALGFFAKLRTNGYHVRPD